MRVCTAQVLFQLSGLHTVQASSISTEILFLSQVPSWQEFKETFCEWMTGERKEEREVGSFFLYLFFSLGASLNRLNFTISVVLQLSPEILGESGEKRRKNAGLKSAVR